MSIEILRWYCTVCAGIVCAGIVCVDIMCARFVCADIVCADIVYPDIVCTDIVHADAVCADMVSGYSMLRQWFLTCGPRWNGLGTELYNKHTSSIEVMHSFLLQYFGSYAHHVLQQL